MHDASIRDEVLTLVGRGLRDAEIAAAVGLSRTTVRDIRSPRRAARPRCPRCWRPTRPMWFEPGEYAELLGLYLGDGCISPVARTQRLRISLDARYPRVVADTRRLVEECLTANRVDVVKADAGATAVVSVYNSHLSCLLPQHGAGKKHLRPIVLEDWQWEMVRAAPWSFLRGCIHSDGCFFINRTGRYRYLSVDFCNRSDDLLDLFAAVCRHAGIDCRPSGHRVRIYRRAAVADFAAYVGPKT